MADLGLPFQPGLEIFAGAYIADRTQLDRVSPAALAYLGDAVYELYIRAMLIFPPKRSQTYHLQVVSWVRAESQAQLLLHLNPHLTAEELDIVRRGRNAATGKPRRLKGQVYQQATALETLLGYLYLADRDRLHHLLALSPINLPDSNPNLTHDS